MPYFYQTKQLRYRIMQLRIDQRLLVNPQLLGSMS